MDKDKRHWITYAVLARAPGNKLQSDSPINVGIGKRENMANHHGELQVDLKE